MNYKLNLLILLFLSFTPSLLYVTLSLPSLTPGILIGLLISLLVIIIQSRKFQISVLTTILCFTIFQIVAITSVSDSLSGDFKTFGSVLILNVFLAFCIIYSGYLNGIHEKQLITSFIYFARILILCGWIGVFFNFNFYNYDKYVKSIFTFFEPSHYALTLGIVLFAALSCVKITEKIFILASAFIFSMYIPSLTLLVYLLLYGLFASKKIIAYLGYISIILASTLVLYSTYPDLADYYLSRIDIFGDTDNLSALVYMQGWSEAFNALVESNGLGLGFQMAGTNSPSLIAEKIYDIAGIYKNRNDGGFLAAKLIIEFGVFGIILILTYVYMCLLSIVKYNPRNKDVKNLFYGIIIAYSVEMFIRSSGYYTFGTLMAITSIMYLFLNKYNSHDEKTKFSH